MVSSGFPVPWIWTNGFCLEEEGDNTGKAEEGSSGRCLDIHSGASRRGLSKYQSTIHQRIISHTRENNCKLTEAAEVTELICEAALELWAAAEDWMLEMVLEAAARMDDSWLAKEDDSEAASPVAVARTEDSESKAALKEASAPARAVLMLDWADAAEEEMLSRCEMKMNGDLIS
jgi:hypothetical protein